MLVERALTLELTPSPEESVTREASERTQVSEVSILMADRAVFRYQRCNKLTRSRRGL